MAEPEPAASAAPASPPPREPADARVNAGPNARLIDRVPTAVLAIAVAIAAYTGFRIPNGWSATLESVSLFDGFHRRFLVGTLLYPLAALTDHSYAVLAGFSFAVLAALIAVVIRAAVRARDPVTSLWIAAWFVAPVGGFLFNEVGYFEQILYLLLFAALHLVRRGRLVPAVIAMALAPCVHEIAILTVIPLFGVALLRQLAFRRALVATVIPATCNALLLAIPGGSQDAIARLGEQLAHASFRYRPDALVLFARTQSENWGLYTVHDVVVYVVPVAIALVAAFAALWWSDRRGWPDPGDHQPPAIVLVASCAAIAIPALLVLGGWDGNRWLFLVIANFFITVWLALDHRPRPALPARAISVLVLAALVISRIQPWYFDRLRPRELDFHGGYRFGRDLVTGALFQPAKGE